MSCAPRVATFCERFGLQVPILLAPMAGVPAPQLSIEVARAGGLGALGAVLMQPQEILAWTQQVRAASAGRFQLNLWTPDPPPRRDPALEAQLREFLGEWGPGVSAAAGDATPPDFASQCEALLEAAPVAASSVMGLFPAPYVGRLKDRGIAWFATVSTVAEAKEAVAAGADAIVAQGMEAGGHRAAFVAANAERDLVGLFALVPAIADAVNVPVIASGAIADGRTVAAAITLGASAVQIGTGFLRCPEAAIPSSWADAIGRTPPEGTQVSRVFSGRAGRSLATDYVRAATAPGAVSPAPYPVQRGLTATMRAQAVRENDLGRMQAWAGQSAALASAEPAARVLARLWTDARRLLGVD
ncbi:MAG: nitronate monooxygenase [Sinobacteraceae bacterium]|nr:nitronate monooxygenase [Nevskiaceae bacterium]